MKAYSLDLRSRVIAAVEAGMPWQDILAVFGISRATLNRYRQRLRETGSLAPGQSPGRPRAIPPAQEPALERQLTAIPDASLARHCQQWATEQGAAVSSSAMRRAIRRLKWTRKKSLSPPANATRRPVSGGGKSPAPSM
jgi:transposase